MSETVWFSYRQEKYDAIFDGARKILKWTGKKQLWNNNNCKVSTVGMSDEKVRIIIRREKSDYSSYMKKKIQVNLMLGLVATKISEPKPEEIFDPPDDKNGKKRKRWAIHLENIINKDLDNRPISDCCIWQWEEMDTSIEESKIYKIYNEIEKQKGNPPAHVNIFDVKSKPNQYIIPVIYQPRVDAWKNFIREVHCHKVSEGEYEVTIIFNDEQLRAHSLLDTLYRLVRLILHQRIKDVESFRIFLKSIPEDFKFPSIYSGDHTLYHDDIHEDKPEDGPLPSRKIKYYYSTTNHPIVFINTSNHAMAERDNNHDHWKWEYVTWERGIPIVYGNKSRKKIDDDFKIIKF